jgi:ankyrin repeat protein
MDLRNTYGVLFDLLKNHKNAEFIKYIEKTMEDDKFFDINIYDDNNKHFLDYAVIMNNIEIVKFLTEKNVLLDTTNDDIPLFIIPIYYNYIDILKILLDADKKSIGKNLVNYRDKFYKTPIHHAIYNKNFGAVDLLLNYGANVDMSDKDKYNALFYAVKSRSVELCKKIVVLISNINAKCITGENNLHISCNLQLYEITELLIINKININIHDNSNEITPLHYCVLLNNIILTNLLIENGADVNLQDIHGNTSLHYSIIENNHEIFNKLMVKNANLNLWNIEGEIPLHLIFKYDRNKWNQMEFLIEKSNLNTQDKNGNSCFYYLIETDMWKKYIYILKKKKLNIFLKNTNNQYIFDIVNKEDIGLFFDLLTDSYIYVLKNTYKQWTEDWDIICTKSIDDLNDDDKKIIKKNNNKINIESLNSPTILQLCKSAIKNKIKKITENIKKNINIECYERSFPIIRPQICINLSEGKNIQNCTFTGTLLDILIGLIFLVKKHKLTTCSILSDKINKKDLCYKYKLNDIITHNNNNCELIHFEIIWSNKRLFIDPAFIINFTNCLKSNKRFIIIPIGIEMKEGSHAGYLIYDDKLKEIERFEPYGGVLSLYGTHYDASLLDEKLESKFKTVDENIKYISPYDYLPKISFQLFDIIDKGKKKIGDPYGFCALWSIWYIDNRIMYNDIPRKKLTSILINNIREKNISFKNLIRNYAMNIIEIRDTILNNSGLDINEWINDQYDEKQLILVLSQINDIIQNIK